MDQLTPQSQPSQRPIPNPIGAPLKMFLSAMAGTLFVLGMQLIPTSRRSVLQPTPIPEGPNPVVRVLHFISSPYVFLPWFLVMMYFAISRRNQPKSWRYAFLA